MSKKFIYFQVGVEVESENDQTAALVAWVIRDTLARSEEGMIDAILDELMTNGGFDYFPADVPPPTDWHFGETRIELDASPLSCWQTSIN